MPKTDVQITPEVLAWAIKESGYRLEDVAARLDVAPATLSAWATAGSEPSISLTQLRELSAFLKRTPATFLLPQAPASHLVPARFRSRGSDRTAPNPEELRYLREAGRLQRIAGWLIAELQRPAPSIGRFTLSTDPEAAAETVRRILAKLAPLPTPDESPALTPAQAFRQWRSAVEATGVLVFAFSIGTEAVAGFSLWDDNAPIIAVNTASNHQARIFTMFHECGHLLTRTSSMCLETGGAHIAAPTDPAERWCEEFAAALLLPWAPVAQLLGRLGYRGSRQIDDLSVTSKIAKTFNVSWRAATIRLIKRDRATWDLYRRIPRAADRKRKGGSAEGGRDRAEIREAQYGRGAIDLFVDAAQRNVLTRIDVLDYLDVPDAALDRLSVGPVVPDHNTP